MICTNRSGEKALYLARKIPTVSQNKATAAKTPDGGEVGQGNMQPELVRRRGGNSGRDCWAGGMLTPRA